MTVSELEARMTTAELADWMEVARLEKEEREQDDRIRRVERNARANRMSSGR